MLYNIHGTWFRSVSYVLLSSYCIQQKIKINLLNVCNSIDIAIFFSFSLWFQISSISSVRLRSVAPENIALRSVLYFLISSYDVKKESSIYKIRFNVELRKMLQSKVQHNLSNEELFWYAWFYGFTFVLFVKWNICLEHAFLFYWEIAC